MQFFNWGSAQHKNFSPPGLRVPQKKFVTKGSASGT